MYTAEYDEGSLRVALREARAFRLAQRAERA
jgi:hypothetical protein